MELAPLPTVGSNPLSLYDASFQAFQVQHAESGCYAAIILALRETQNDQPMEEEKASIPSLSPVELAPPPTVGSNDETPIPKKSTALKRQTRSESRNNSYIIPSILEPPMNDESVQEGSPVRSTVAKARAASSITKGHASKGPF